MPLGRDDREPLFWLPGAHGQGQGHQAQGGQLPASAPGSWLQAAHGSQALLIERLNKRVQAPGASLPPPPTAAAQNDVQYLPRSLKRLLEAKARPAGLRRRRCSLARGSPSARPEQEQVEAKRRRLTATPAALPADLQRSSRPAAGRPGAAPAAAPPKAVPEQQPPPSKPLREGRARYLKAKKSRKQQRSKEWAQQQQQQEGSTLTDAPAFGEQVEAPLLGSLRNRQWGADSQAAKQLAQGGEADRAPAAPGRATMASLKALVRQQAARTQAAALS